MLALHATVKPRALLGRLGRLGLFDLFGLFGLGLALSAPGGAMAAPTEQQCLDRFRADTARIEREFAARRRSMPASSPSADQAWARDMHAALAKAADAGEACSRQARQGKAPAEPRR